MNYISFFFEESILLVLIISLIIILFYYFFFYINLNFYKKNQLPIKQPLSIIICAKNELENLKQNLVNVLEQKFYEFEVIVVNDQSSDESNLFLESIKKKYKNLVLVNIKPTIKHKAGKKFALTLGIKTAKYENLLLIDADCLPNSNLWARNMSSNFNNSNIVLGYGAYKKKKGLLNKIIRYDTFIVAQQYLSFSLKGITYMGVGRNLAYKKSLFFDNNGFAKHLNIQSGDDDLFIQDIASNNNVAIEISKDSHTMSNVMENWSDWIYQKRRHLTTSPHYKNKIKIILAIFPIAQLSFYSSIIILIIYNEDLFYACLLLFIKFISSYFINYKTMKSLNVYDLFWTHPFYEILNLLLQVNFVLLNLLNKPKRWSR